MQLPPLTARNHPEAVAALKARRAILLNAASDLTDRAALFTDTPEVFDMLTAEVRSLIAQADLCLPRAIRTGKSVA